MSDTEDTPTGHFTRLTADEVGKHGTEYQWINTRYDEMPEAERRADVAVLEALFGTDSVREYLRSEYDIGVFADHERKLIAVGVSLRNQRADGMVAVDERAVVPKLSALQRHEIRGLLALSINNPDHAYAAVMEALGQPKDDIVLVSAGHDMLDA